jgi:hypothetical protein
LYNPKSPNTKKNNIPSNLLTLESRNITRRQSLDRSTSKKRKTITNSNISVMNPINLEDFKNDLIRVKKSNSLEKKYFGFSDAVIKYYDTENKNLIKSTLDKMVFSDVSRKMSGNIGANPILNLVKISKENFEKNQKNFKNEIFEENENFEEKIQNKEILEKKNFSYNHTDLNLQRNYLPEYSLNIHNKRPLSAEKRPHENEVEKVVENLIISNYNTTNYKRSSNRRKSRLTISNPKNEEMKKIKIEALRNTSIVYENKNSKAGEILSKDYVNSNKENTTAATERENKLSNVVMSTTTLNKFNENNLESCSSNYNPPQTQKNFYKKEKIDLEKNFQEKNIKIYTTYNQVSFNGNIKNNKKLLTQTSQNYFKKCKTQSNKLRIVPVIKRKKLINIYGDEVDDMLSLVNDLKNCSLFSTTSAASNSTNITKH